MLKIPVAFHSILILWFSTFAGPVSGQSSEGADVADRGESVEATVNIRAVLHDRSKLVDKLYFLDKSGEFKQIKFRRSNLSQAQEAIVQDGVLRIYDSLEFNENQPDAHLISTIKVPEGLEDIVVILIPVPQESSFVLKNVCIDDSPGSFPGGESRALNLIHEEVSIQAGEHKVSVLADEINTIPPVEERNEFNMAQTNFYYTEEGAAHVFHERQVKYVNGIRRIYIISDTPGAKVPNVTTIVDAARAP